MLLRTTIFWSLTALSLPTTKVAHAQQAPFVTLEKFSYMENVTYRTNVCERQRLLFLEEIELSRALENLTLTSAITNYKVANEDKLFSLKDGKIREGGDPGLFVIIMDEVARRAGFEWRNSFSAIDPIDTSTDGNKTWTDLLEWEIDHFDIAVDYWGRSQDRMALGISFPKGWYDGSIILAQSVAVQTEEDSFSLWAFLLPFDTKVWMAIVGSIWFTGIMYFILERLNTDSDERELENKPAASVFLASLTFTGHFEYRPNTNSARLLSFSWTFWALIITSAYTANLASFLVSRNEIAFSVSTLEDALKQGTPVCIQRYSVMDEIVSKKYPNMNIVRKSSEQEIFDALRLEWFGGSSGCGVALTNLGTFDLYQRNKEVNYDCTLTSEKRVVQNLPSGFATAVDTGVMCTSLISYVLNIHFQEMISDGFIERAWIQHLDRTADINCDKVAGEGSESQSERESFSLSLKDTAGIFAVHGALTLLALLIAFGDLRFRSRKHSIENTEIPQ